MEQTNISANTLLHNSLCYWRKSSDSWKESIGWSLPNSFQHTECCLNVKHHESNDILHLFLMKYNLKSSSKGIWSLMNSFMRKNNSLSLNPKTFLEISLPFSDSEAFSWGIGARAGNRHVQWRQGGSWLRAHKVSESWGGIEINTFPGWGYQCKGCWVVSFGPL